MNIMSIVLAKSFFSRCEKRGQPKRLMKFCVTWISRYLSQLAVDVGGEATIRSNKAVNDAGISQLSTRVLTLPDETEQRCANYYCCVLGQACA